MRFEPVPVPVLRRVARPRRIAANDNARPVRPGSWIPDHPWLYRGTD